METTFTSATTQSPCAKSGDTVMFFDVETTGLPTRYDAPYSRVDVWPRIVSVCWAFYTTAGDELQHDYAIVKPNGFLIPDEAALIHGITTERALQEGTPLKSVLNKMTADIQLHRPLLAVAHNIRFDEPVLHAEFLRCMLPRPLVRMRKFCTMSTTTELCRLRPRRQGKFKWPKLVELHRHLFGTEFSAGHHAGADVKACAECFFELQRTSVAGPWKYTFQS